MFGVWCMGMLCPQILLHYHKLWDRRFGYLLRVYYSQNKHIGNVIDQVTNVWSIYCELSPLKAYTFNYKKMSSTYE